MSRERLQRYLARSGVWLLFLAATPAARSLHLEPGRERRIAGIAVPVAVALALLGVVRGPLASGAGDPLLDEALRRAAGTPILAESIPAEQVALAGGRVWMSNPLDAFSHRNQRLYLDWLAGRPTGDAALRYAGRVVIVIRGDAPAKRMPLLYFASAKGLIAIPVKAVKPRDALDMYLSGPSSPDITGLPPDVRLLAYDYDSADRVLSLKFSYTSSVRALAMDRPDRMRTVLLGLIASLTEFSEVRAVRLDFSGQTRLGLGQCSDLLRTPQTRPVLLNDERLL